MVAATGAISQLAKTRGTVVVEGSNAASRPQPKGLSGARSRRRGLRGAPPEEAVVSFDTTDHGAGLG